MSAARILLLALLATGLPASRDGRAGLYRVKSQRYAAPALSVRTWTTHHLTTRIDGVWVTSRGRLRARPPVLLPLTESDIRMPADPQGYTIGFFLRGAEIRRRDEQPRFVAHLDLVVGTSIQLYDDGRVQLTRRTRAAAHLSEDTLLAQVRATTWFVQGTDLELDYGWALGGVRGTSADDSVSMDAARDAHTGDWFISATRLLWPGEGYRSFRGRIENLSPDD